ncbi:beta/gamma crystallin domain-containing protein [Fodinicola feengrottensis]|uniref:beta/gamma crystallin domain-containing protein n=1 Tax=Fodinicola feengrottensis TaxID=435914 RepID=UPI0013D7C3E0|nr:beta/gamma crystallin domain-containing protein [Fodinicola feengrottensis]
MERGCLAASAIAVTMIGSLFVSSNAQAAAASPNIVAMNCKSGIDYFQFDVPTSDGDSYCFAYAGSLPLNIADVDYFQAGNNSGSFTYLDPSTKTCRIRAFTKGDYSKMPLVDILSLTIISDN